MDHRGRYILCRKHLRTKMFILWCRTDESTTTVLDMRIQRIPVREIWASASMDTRFISQSTETFQGCEAR
jgi:hypothetical protein